MSSALFLIIFLGAFIATVIIIYKRRKRFWQKPDGGTYTDDGLFLPDDTFKHHSHSATDHHDIGHDDGTADD